MTDGFDWQKNNSDALNAYLEGWQAAYNLHIRKPEGPGFHNAWLESSTFARLLTDEEKRKDPWQKIALDHDDQAT